MKTLFSVLCMLSLAAAAEAPTLTDTQKLEIRNKQITVSEMAREKASLQGQIIADQSRLKELEPDLQKASDDLQTIIKKDTPTGWVLQMDLTFKAEEKTPPK